MTDRDEKRRRVTRAVADPVYFHEVYIAPYDPNWKRDEYGHPVPMPAFGAQMLYAAAQTPRLVVQLPPEFMKTTLLSQGLPTWETVRAVMLHQGALRGMLLSEEEDMAKNNLSVIAWHLIENELIRRDFSDDEGRPLIYPDPQENTWKDDAIVVCRRGVSKDPTWQAKGLDSKGIHGRRIDRLRADDLVTPANAASPTKRKNALKLWDEQVTTRLVASGIASIAGNYNDEKDLLSTLMRRGRYVAFKRPALAKADDPSKPDENGVELWPEVWPKSRLREEKSEKPLSFRRIFMLDDRNREKNPLKEEWVTLLTPEDTPWGYAKYYIGMDPAPGSVDSDPDFFNITAGALHSDNRLLDVVLSLDVRANPKQQMELVKLVYDRFHRMGLGVVALGISRAALDRYFGGALTIGLPELDAKLVDVPIPGDEAAKQARLEMLGPYCSTGFLRVQEEVWHAVTSNTPDQHQEETLSEQWVNFPAVRHDDKLDGLDIMIRVAREYSNVGSSSYELELHV